MLNQKIIKKKTAFVMSDFCSPCLQCLLRGLPFQLHPALTSTDITLHQARFSASDNDIPPIPRIILTYFRNETIINLHISIEILILTSL